jgi:hypothetical protein
MAKKWYVREKNSSKLVEGDWIYYVHDKTWSVDLSSAKAFKTKKEAEAFSSDVYGK